MVNHPNRGWRSRWTVDLEAATATHRDGWQFQFLPAEDDPGQFVGNCIVQPPLLTPEQIASAARIAREAGDIFVETRATERRSVGRPETIGGRRVQVYLDEKSLTMAASLGDGNISEGIRRALKSATD